MNAHLLIALGFLKLCLGDASEKDLFPILPVAAVNSGNDVCKKESILYVENLNNLTLWAFKMWDATAKSTTGSLDGNMYHMGDWHECRKVKAPFKTQYCLAEIKTDVSWISPPEDPYSLERDPFGSVLKRILNTHDVSQVERDTAYVGWCVPASCTLDDLEIALNEGLNNSKSFLQQHNVSYTGKIHEKFCQKQDERKTFDMLDGAFCILSAFFVFVVLIATFYEYKMENELTDKEKQNMQKNLGRRILIGFSARKNFADLAKSEESNPALAPLYGLRTFAIFMIILGHRFGTFTSGPVLNLDYVEQKYRSIEGSVIFHGDLFVDTFFVLSGLLVTYCLLVQYNKKYINPGFVIFLRYMRLTPLFAFVIFYYVTLLNYIGSGPLWKLVVQQESQDCRDNWWISLLYINNYVNEDRMCLVQTWYLSCDFHYFIIAILLVLIFMKNKKLGFALFIVCFVLSIVAPFIIILSYLRPGMLLFYSNFLRDPKAHPDFILTYIKSHTRATAYCVGVIAGYLYYKLKDSEKKLSKWKSHFISIVSIFLILVAFVSGGVLYNPYHKYNAIEHAVFASLFRLPWSFGSIGLLLTASYGHATIIQKFLSWSPFIPLSRLVYAAYLVHLGLQYRALGMSAGAQTFDIYNLCMVQTWYLACDFHFFLIAVLIIFLTTKRKKLGITLFLLCFILSILVPFAITLMYSKQAMARMYPELLRNVKAHPDFMNTYIKSHYRANAYFVGMVAGYVYYELKISERKFSRVKSHLITMASFLLITVAVISSVPFFDPYHGYNVIEHAIFAALSRLPWSLGTVGLILTASYGHASIIQKIFSWYPFVPLSKLSYAAYLVQITFQYRSLGKTTAAATFNIFTLITTTFADIVISFITALVLYIVIEMPIRKLIKGLLMNTMYVVPAASETTTLSEEAANANGRKLDDDRIELRNLNTVEK